MQSFNESAHFLEQNAFLSALSALLQSVFSSYLVSRLQSAVLSYPQKQERLAAFGTHLDAISGKVVALCLEEAAHTLRQQHLAFPPPPAPVGNRRLRLGSRPDSGPGERAHARRNPASMVARRMD